MPRKEEGIELSAKTPSVERNSVERSGRPREIMAKTRWRATDLFAGCGGLSAGLRDAGFEIVSAVEKDKLAADTYQLNHPDTKLLNEDITDVSAADLRSEEDKIDLVAGCPPCQGFSRVRRKNRARAAKDPRNSLIDEYLRLVEELEPTAVFLENVPGIERDNRFKHFLNRLDDLDYEVTCEPLELSEYGVPQRRKRVVVLAGKGFKIPMPSKLRKVRTVRDAIYGLPRPTQSSNPLHNQVTKHNEQMKARISAVPKNGGSRSAWPEELRLQCHDDCDGFKDVYGRMEWDQPSPTITGGCINASKGRFLHPRQNRAITLFEAALLQTFRRRYKFSLERGRYCAAEMIGNALPPKFAERVGLTILRALQEHHSGRRIHTGEEE